MASALKVVNMAATVADSRLTQSSVQRDSQVGITSEMSSSGRPTVTPSSPATSSKLLKGSGIGVTGFDSPPNGVSTWSAPDPKVGW